MVRSGWVSRRRRAGSPTTMPPSGSRLTTEGQRVEPKGPVMHTGFFVCGSKYATRLLVVPRSIPTMRPIFSLSLGQLLRDICDKVAQVGAAVQKLIHAGHEFLARLARCVGINRDVPFARDRLQLDIHYAELFLKNLFGGLEPRFERAQIAARLSGVAEFVQRFV